ncbi:glutathione S-transferase family protein [Pikeienuella piscinae]|uniref:Glutathione S-transferase family protein n=1 Tax=Pikeienuella piscinae TaxID=2748098 RepID=A0A7L5BVB1_9RHOB|nr:glutathione S-transferase C-terminal domain-containing protein [Pikeienuella piscinae]QIE55013.1 glutathione S-transferase family protein [Pikeienuella piscinae]
MIDLYTWATPNGHKVHVMLEECALPYRVHPVHIGRGEQFAPEFLAISPNNRIPAIIDRGGPGGAPMALAESGAILIYLAEKTGRFLAPEGPSRHLALQWVMFQMSAVGPIFGQCYHFRTDAPEPVPYAIDRFTREARRLYGVLDKRLAEARYLAGEELSIADFATWPWAHGIAKQGHDPADYPNVIRWFEEIRARPAVRRGVKVLSESRRLEMNAAERDILFGDAGPRRPTA